MTWSLYNNKNEFLPPLKYSNGKTQEDVVNEVIKAIKEGHKIIFIKGMAGTGKSVIALNIAKELGKASIVVPVKYLQKQYQEDYTNKLYLLKENKQKLKITTLTGRNNHKCLYNPQVYADDRLLPCDIPIKKENEELLRAYIKNNPLVNEEDFEGFEDIRRFSVAAACPYWSPIISKEYGSYKFPDSKSYDYQGLKNKQFVYHQRKPGCTYYEQFMSYITSDVIIFNSRKYELENQMDRKPSTEVEIIDECDEFLDSLGNEKRLNLNLFAKKLREILEFCKDEDTKTLLQEILDLVNDTLEARWLEEMIENEEILKLRDTKILDLFELLIKNEQLLEYEELEYFFEIALNFEGLFDTTYVAFIRKKNSVIARVVNINLEKKLKEIVDKNKAFVMMSGTLHSKKVLKEIFDIKDFIVVEAETQNIGKPIKVFTKSEKNFRYKEFKEGKVTREDYLKALNKCIEMAESPVLVHVNSFSDLPTEEEKEKYDLSILSRGKLEEMQLKYKEGELLQWFKEGKMKILYSTKCNRGVDLPGSMCNSIVFTKFPYPSMDSVFWRILKQEKPNEYLDFYFDKANREFLQRIYRGLRSKYDKVKILSPDSKVLRSLA